MDMTFPVSFQKIIHKEGKKNFKIHFLGEPLDLDPESNCI
jgi:hypothetical protein